MDTSLCLKAGLHVIAPPIAVVGGSGSLEMRSCLVPAASSFSRNSNSSSISVDNRSGPLWGFSFRHPLRLFRHDATTLAVEDPVFVEEEREKEQKTDKEEDEENGEKNDNWVLKILHVRSMWKQETGEEQVEKSEEMMNGVSNSSCDDDDDENGCEGGCSVSDDDGGGNGKTVVFDRDSFSKLLRRVPLAEARLYSRLSYIGNLAYSIPQIKPANLIRSHGLRFVTSSLEKKELVQAEDAKKSSSEDDGKDKIENPENLEEMERQSAENEENEESMPVEEKEQVQGHKISAAVAYQIAASAASYLQSHTKSMLPLMFFNSKHEGEKQNVGITDEDVASLMATTDSVTAVVAAKEEVKQAVADDLNSTHSPPCEWFACDDEQTGTRYFIIQGSESLASWQANLFFEPVPFEGFDVLVHRGIYEAAKGIYQQMLPEVRTHLQSNGNRATFRFTGHSLGGSLSLLINLMLLIRGEVPASSLLPVITFGAPTVMCGGNRLLEKLGLPQSHVRGITLHRDIVPRAFSCHYPSQVAEFLKVVNGNFRTLPCLCNQMLYAPMGDFLILQPDNNFSPSHELLPEGSGLYLMTYPVDDPHEGAKQIEAAQTVFLNSPHPLEILSDRGAYGSGGHIQRDHDMNSYLKSFRHVIRGELNRIRKSRRQVRRRVWWPLVAGSSGGENDNNNVGIAVGSYVESVKVIQEQLNLSGMVQSGKESLKRFGRVVTSGHIHLLVVFLLPARLLILGTSRILL